MDCFCEDGGFYSNFVIGYECVVLVILLNFRLYLDELGWYMFWGVGVMWLLRI